jgi:hypothetical protein
VTTTRFVSCPLPDVDPVPIRWPDPPNDLAAEALANVLLASPAAGRLYIEALKVALNTATTTDGLVTELYRAGVVFGQKGGPDGAEAGGLLWALADALRDSLNDWAEVAR